MIRKRHSDAVGQTHTHTLPELGKHTFGSTPATVALEHRQKGAGKFSTHACADVTRRLTGEQSVGCKPEYGSHRVAEYSQRVCVW